MQSDIGKALFLTLKKAFEQGMIGDDKDFSGKVCVKWKDTEFERQVRSESLIRILNATKNWVDSKAFRSIAHQTWYMETMLQCTQIGRR